MVSGSSENLLLFLFLNDLINGIFGGFGLLAGQNMTFEEVTLCVF